MTLRAWMICTLRDGVGPRSRRRSERRLRTGRFHHRNVTFDRILRSTQEPQNWLTYSGNLRAIDIAR